MCEVLNPKLGTGFPTSQYDTGTGVLPDFPTGYCELVGHLVYLNGTNHDIAYVVHVVSQFVSAPRSTHCAVILRIWHYDRGSIFSVYFLPLQT